MIEYAPNEAFAQPVDGPAIVPVGPLGSVKTIDVLFCDELQPPCAITNAV